MIRNLFKIRVLGISLLLGLCLNAPIVAQARLGPTAIKISDGHTMLTINSEVDSLLLELKGQKVELKATSNVPIFNIDGKLVQIVTAEIGNFVTGAERPADSGILEKHKVWESDYASEHFGKLQVESEALSVNNTASLFWGFKRTKLNESYDRDYFLTRVVGKNVLVLSSPLKPGESVAEYKTFLVRVMETLRLSDKPIDIVKIAEDVRKSAAAKENKPPQR